MASYKRLKMHKKSSKRKLTVASADYRNTDTESKPKTIVGWTPHPTIKLIVGPSEEVILIHRKIVSDLNIQCPGKTDSTVCIPIPNVDPQCLRILLNYIYNEELNVTIDNVWKTLVTCWQFIGNTPTTSIANAQARCIDFMFDNINLYDCWELWKLARMYDMTELIAALENYMAKDLRRFKDGLIKLNYDELKQFLKSDEVCGSSSREARCHAAILWIEEDVVEREQVINDLMKEMNLQSLPLALQNKLISQHAVLARNAQWMKLYQEILDMDDCGPLPFTLNPNIFENDFDPDINIEDVVCKIEQDDLPREIRKWPASTEDIVLDSDSEENTAPVDVPQFATLHAPINSVPSKQNPIIIIVSGNEENGSRAVWSYNVKTKTKVPLGFADSRINDFFLCRNNVLFHLGGSKGDIVTKDVRCIKLLDQERCWESCPPMQVSRCYLSAVVMQGDIYAIGGNMNGEAVMNSVDKLKFNEDSYSDQWEIFEFLNRSRDAFDVAVDDENTIYVVGGCGQNNKTSKHSSVLPLVEEYSSGKGRWYSSRRLNQKRMFHRVVYLNGYIYAIGGYDGKHVLSSVEKYDGDSSGKWTRCAPMLKARKEMSVIVLDERIYVIGGKGQNDQPLSSCEEYDPYTNRWKSSDILSEKDGPFHFVLKQC